uniref:Putative YopX protein n=1 Tax=viral metagenome TaxID=1070528 RepID=A0A6M3IWM7_9ZZZZ
MREIKFRAWDKYVEKMVTEPGFINMGGEAKRECAIYHEEELRWENITDRIELMQFIGLLDKNGKEIYEGDIVEFTSDVLKMKKLFYIEFENARFIPVPFTKDISEVASNGEVIGNIYEHSNLLDKQNGV